MTLSRLGGITHVLHSPRFVREKLADEISGSLKSGEVESLQSVHAAPAMLLPASVEKKTATVTFDADKTSAAALVKATTDAGYPSVVRK